MILFLIIASIGFSTVYILNRGRDGTGIIFPVNKHKNEKINVLLLGIHPSGLLTDFIMVAGYDPQKQTLSLLSVPRDTRVNGTIDRKINSAYAKRKDVNDVMDKVRDVTGLKIDKYILVDTKGFRNLIDGIGGVPFDVPLNMNYDDDEQNLHIHLKKGMQTLNGKKAEEFTRWRKNNDGTGYFKGDEERVQTQQKFLAACLNQTLKPYNIIKIPQLAKIGFDNVKTNLQLTEMLAYADDVAKFKKENVTAATIVGEGRYIGIISYFIYDPDKTRELVDSMFNDIPSKTTLQNNAIVGDNAINIEKESIRVEVLNATPKKGLANKVAEKLKGLGFNVIKVGNYKSTKIEATRVIDRTDKKLAQKLRDALNEGKVLKEYSDLENVDVTLIIGHDFKL